MIIKQTYQCICGVQKQESNHWFLLFNLPSGAIRVEHWNPVKINYSGVLHLCGQNCLLKAISMWTTEPVGIVPGEEIPSDVSA